MMMKLRSIQTSLTVVLLAVLMVGCKSALNSSSTAANTNDASKNTNSTSNPPTDTRTSTSTSSSTPEPPKDISGKYNVAGSNPDGGGYKGTLEIISHGDVYQFRWNAGVQYDGVGVTNGNVVAVAFANGANGKGCGVVDYEIGGDGTLEGKWGYWGVDDAGSEKATRNGGSGLTGEYDAVGKNPDGKEYKAKLTVEPAGNLYRFVWSNDADGVGIKQGTNVAVGIGGKRCGFVAYQIKSDGLDGIWGGYGTDKTGTEKATKQ
jgi:hypothetical protein